MITIYYYQQLKQDLRKFKKFNVEDDVVNFVVNFFVVNFFHWLIMYQLNTGACGMAQ